MPATISAVTWRDRTFFVAYLAAAGEPHSSLTQLVQGIWDTEPGQARAILRRRIQTTDELTPLNWGMVKTSAQRVTRVAAIEPQPGWQRMEFLPRHEPRALDAAQAGLPPMELAGLLAGLSVRQDSLHASDRPVGCVLVGANGALLAWAHNTNGANRTLHAEVNLVQKWWAHAGQRIPIGARLFTTLQPCRMCQGMIHTVGSHVPVLYRDPDRVRPVPFELACRRFDERE